MAKESFAKAMPNVFGHEGGYVDHPSDPGGATNMGITLATLRDWRGSSVSKGDVKALSRSEAMEIYRANYWEAIRGDDLPAGVDYAVFDFGINSGTKRAAQYLQRIVGVTQDGKIGPVTLAAAAKWKPADLVNELCNARLSFLMNLSTWKTFGKGWKTRVAEVRSIALQLAKAEPEPEVGGNPPWTPPKPVLAPIPFPPPRYEGEPPHNDGRTGALVFFGLVIGAASIVGLIFWL